MTSVGEVTATGRLIFDASQVSSGAQGAINSMNGLYGVVRNNWWGLQAIGQSLSQIGRAAGGALVGAIKSASDYQQSLAGVARTTYTIGDSFKKNATDAGLLGKQLQALAETTPFSLSDVMGLAEQAGALGVARKNITDYTKTLLQLVQTTEYTTQNVTSLAKVGNILGLDTQQFQAFTSVIYQLGVSTAATAPQIGDMTTRLAPVGKLVGLTAPQIAALSATVLSLGPHAELGATAVSRALQQMAAAAGGSTATAKKALVGFSNVAGVTANDFIKLEKTNPEQAFAKFIYGLSAASKNSVAFKQAIEATGISEQREITALASLASGTTNLNRSTADLSTITGMANNEYAKHNALTRAAAMQNATLASKFEITKNIFHNAAIALGQEFAPAVDKGNTALRSLASFMRNLNPTARTMAGSVLLVVGGLGMLGGAVLNFAARAFLARQAFTVLNQTMQQNIRLQLAKSNADGAGAATTASAALAAGFHAKALQTEAIATAQSYRAAELEAGVLANRNKILVNELAIRDLELSLSKGNLKAGSLRVGQIEAEIAARTAENTVLKNTIILQEENIAVTDAEAISLSIMQKAAYGAGVAFRMLIGPIGIAIATIATVVSMVGLLSQQDQVAQQKTEDLSGAVNSLTDAFRAQADGAREAMAAELAKQIVDDKIAAGLKRFGLNINEVIAALQSKDPVAAITKLLNSTALGQTISGYLTQLDRLKHGTKVGDILPSMTSQKNMPQLLAQYNSLLQKLKELAINFAAASGKADQQKAVAAALGLTWDQVATGAGAAGAGLRDVGSAAAASTPALDGMYSAAQNMYSDALSLQQANLGLAQAQQTLNQAQRDSLKLQRDLASAQRSVVNATLSLAQAQAQVKDNTAALQFVREKAANTLRGDVFAVEDAKSAQVQAADQVRAAEQKLHDLRSKHDRTLELADATNKLRDARLSLRDATVGVGDAEYQLKYLIAQGASAREIADAQRNVAASKAAQSDARTGVSQAEVGVHDVQDAHSARAIATAERELRDARRASSEAALREHEAELQLKEDRKLNSVQKAYARALLQQRQSLNAVADAEGALADARAHVDDIKAEEKANYGVQSALLAVQQAALQVAQAQATLSGDIHALTGKTETARQKYKDFHQALMGLPPDIRRELLPALQALGSKIKGVIGGKKLTITVDKDQATRDVNAFKQTVGDFLRLMQQPVNIPKFTGNVVRLDDTHYLLTGKIATSKTPPPSDSGSKHPPVQMMSIRVPSGSGTGPGAFRAAAAARTTVTSPEIVRGLTRLAEHGVITNALLREAFGVNARRLTPHRTTINHNERHVNATFHLAAYTNTDVRAIGRDIVHEMNLRI